VCTRLSGEIAGLGGRHVWRTAFEGRRRGGFGEQHAGTCGGGQGRRAEPGIGRVAQAQGPLVDHQRERVVDVVHLARCDRQVADAHGTVGLKLVHLERLGKFARSVLGENRTHALEEPGGQVQRERRHRTGGRVAERRLKRVDVGEMIDVCVRYEDRGKMRRVHQRAEV